MFLSFIIPIYNCEQYIKQNLDIILDSGLMPADYEIILVDDGSSDGSAAICKRYAERDSNIKYVFQRNQGPSTARNTGLEHALGDYIWFVDADDSINPEILPRLKAVVEAEEYPDLISFGYVSQYPDRDLQTTDVEEIRVCNGLEFLQMPRHGSYLWNNIYKRASIGTRRFIDGVRHIEDACFNIQNILNFGKVVVLPDVGYYYNRKNVNSISKGRRLQDRIKANDDSYIVYSALYNDMLAETDQQKKDFLWRQLNFSISAHLYTMMMQFDDMGTVKRYIGEYRKMGFYPLSPTGNRKADLFARFANHELLLLFVVTCRSFYKRFER